MRDRQRGVTFVGWLFLLIPLALVGYAAIRLTPVYLNYMRVARSLDQVAAEATSGGGSTADGIKNALGKRFDIEDITYPDVKDIEVHRDGGDWTLEAKYDDGSPLFGNVSLLVSFDKIARSTASGD